jgi:hypothetical protein
LDELRERAVRHVFDSRRPIAHVAEDLGIRKEALCLWVRQADPGSEPFLAHTSSDEVSILIPSGANAASPATCFGVLTPGIRLFARSDDAAPATLHVRVIATGLLWHALRPRWWHGNCRHELAADSGLRDHLSQLGVSVGTESIRIEFTTTGNVQIDDVYIDPFVSR